MNIALQDRLAIGELVASYAWASDSRDFAGMAELFCADATVTIETVATGIRTEVRGAREIADYVESRHRDEFARGHRRRHMTDCLVIDFCDGRRAASRAYFCVVVSLHGRAPSTTAMGWYEDSFRKEGERWRFDRRRIFIEGK